MSAADFLVEIGTEELPPKALKTLSSRFRTELEVRMAGAGLAFSSAAEFATPRRLAVLMESLAREQAGQATERRGPAVSAAFDPAGQPTPAALGFARSCNVPFEDLARLKTDKGEWLVHRAQQSGRPASELIPGIVDAALAALPIPKRMRWGARNDEFVRPVHWVVLLHGTEIVPATILGITSDRITRGHRFMGKSAITLNSPAEYVTALEREGRVRVNFAARRADIERMIAEAAKSAGGRAIVDDLLLDEVTALVEWPAPIVGSFDAHFLAVPREALIATMQGNQKYFPLEAADGQLLNQFITISNIESPNPEFIRDGNQRVIRPRLSDAAFFYDKDRKTPLAARRAQLGTIIFERRLGTLLEKTDRVAKLARILAPAFAADPAHTARAAELSRCDLLSEMVGEFPELQGTMGGYYATHDGEPRAVATALGEFYHPRFAGDVIPTSPTGRCVAVADRLDTLVGIFAVAGAPSGDKDPFALRRAALGCLRICIEAIVPLDLEQALTAASAGYSLVIPPALPAQVLDFILERSRAYFAERGKRADVLEAVLVTRPTVPFEIEKRVTALEAFLRLSPAASLAAANKRISNILKKAETGSGEFTLTDNADPAERALATTLYAVRDGAEPAYARGDYAEYLTQLAQLHEPINAFFDGVMVMAEDSRVRANRLALLRQIHGMFLRVADIACISQ
jgi:glycyl-tRNA synthetase beta chain